ncbi:Retrovirus-related Pol polyprotein from transposon RE2 [Linum perenne]
MFGGHLLFFLLMGIAISFYLLMIAQSSFGSIVCPTNHKCFHFSNDFVLWLILNFKPKSRAYKPIGVVNFVISSFLHTHGIQHRVSCPHTQEQNGAVERRNRVIVEKGLALLAHSSLPHLFWEHAFKTATFLHNRTITPILDFQSPYQRLYHATPDYSLLKTFGCLCYPYLRPYNSHKIDFRSLPCVFLGYSSSHKGYLCYHQSSSRLYIARHVIFDESAFPFRSTPPPARSETSPQLAILPTLLQHAASPCPCSQTDLQSSHITAPTNNSHSLSNSHITQLPPTQTHTLPPSHIPHASPTFQISHAIPTSHTTPNIDKPTPSTNPLSSSPSYQQQTISSAAKYTQPSKTHYRPASLKTHSMSTRASTNSLKPKTFTVTTTTLEPKNYSQALKHDCWLQAMKSEYDALVRNETWLLVPRPTNVNVVGCKWIYRIKRHSDGTIQRYKARLVAQGYSQEEGVDFFDTFSPVIKPTTIRVVLSIALSKGWQLRQLDFNNAFLNGDLEEEVYMAQPKGFEHPTKSQYVCRLRKAIYGLKQAPRAWFTKLKGYLLQHGFKACHSDTSLFVLHSPTATTYILVYVDDLIITGSDTRFITTFIDTLAQTFSLKDLGQLHQFLGLDVTRVDNTLQLSQRHYISDILIRTHMDASSPVATPADPTTNLTKLGEQFDNPKLYRQTVGALQYATITRPDITYAVNRVCQYMHAPTVQHWQAVKRVLRYLNGTLNHCLKFTPTTATSLLAYSDAGWVSDKDDSRSQYGYAIYHGNNLISWTSRKQKVVARSSTEAEYRSLAYTTAELIWLQQLFGELHIHLDMSPLLLCDNVGAIFMSKNPVISTRSKHVALDFHFIREQVESRSLRINYISTVDQVADIFTKALPRERLHTLRTKLQVQPILELAGG